MILQRRARLILSHAKFAGDVTSISSEVDEKEEIINTNLEGVSSEPSENLTAIDGGVDDRSTATQDLDAFDAINESISLEDLDLIMEYLNSNPQNEPVEENSEENSMSNLGKRNSEAEENSLRNKKAEYSSCHVSHGSLYPTGSSSCVEDPVFYDLDSEFKRVKVDSPSNHYDKRMENSTSISNHHHQKVEKCSMLDLVSQLELKPIITKLINKDESIDPDRDFKESTMEMIMEHNMSTKEEFEQLLACYLSLNPGIYHELIVKVFKQIWFEITGN
ncbi:hypothetical protein POM88_050348 [Heracleum sosnowskyi]|uniref:Transcription repressor n=1 Tax=Heracleum sosnowskyi TaxID=360622 RepID=A0AAD8M2G9_9APIA|nr:hypothetical protein POM88_050348 [Heracleum sosnowskyi]